MRLCSVQSMTDIFMVAQNLVFDQYESVNLAEKSDK